MESVLYGMKKMLIGWGYSKGCVKVDPESSTLFVAERAIVKATISDFTLSLRWADGEWESWEDLQSSSELAAVKDTAKSKLDKAKQAAKVCLPLSALSKCFLAAGFNPFEGTRNCYGCSCRAVQVERRSCSP